MEVKLVPGSIEHFEALIQGADAFLKAYRLQVADGYMPFAGALQMILNQMKAAQLWHPWLPYLFLLPSDQALIGLGGFKFPPNVQRYVEIGYAVALEYQGKGFATSATRQLIQIAFESTLVDSVCAHTLAEHNASTRVLEKCGLTQVSEEVDPDVGEVWRWEIQRSQW
jgi:[ribosomal protein S5]-alanine N-acetyltransferase